MPDNDFESRKNALQIRPRLRGTLVTETQDTVVLQAKGCLLEVPAGSIAERVEREGSLELSLTSDAELFVSTLIAVGQGVVADNVFGALIDAGLVSSNCNCNCNCDTGNCNCNCNCDCDCTECSVCTGSIVRSVASGLSLPPLVAPTFRRRRSG